MRVEVNVCYSTPEFEEGTRPGNGKNHCFCIFVFLFSVCAFLHTSRRDCVETRLHMRLAFSEGIREIIAQIVGMLEAHITYLGFG